MGCLITDPLYLPLKRGGPVCPPLEGTMIFNEPGGKICENLWNLWETKIIIRGRMELKNQQDAWRCRRKNISLHNKRLKGEDYGDFNNTGGGS